MGAQADQTSKFSRSWTLGGSRAEERVSAATAAASEGEGGEDHIEALLAQRGGGGKTRQSRADDGDLCLQFRRPLLPPYFASFLG